MRSRRPRPDRGQGGYGRALLIGTLAGALHAEGEVGVALGVDLRVEHLVLEECKLRTTTSNPGAYQLSGRPNPDEVPGNPRPCAPTLGAAPN